MRRQLFKDTGGCNFFYLAFSLALFCLADKSIAQDSTSQKKLHLFSGKEQIDMIDVARYVFFKNAGPRKDTSDVKTGKLHASLFPGIQYSLQTGFEGTIVGNGAFYTSNKANANISNIQLSVNYTQKSQFFLPVEGSVWTKENKYNILTDWQFAKFPQNTYGLGSFTTTLDADLINFSYIRFYQIIYKTILPDFYIGAGYDLNYYWNIREITPPAGMVTDFEKYGITPTATSSGVTLSTLYDTRRNSINPEPGYYANITYRDNLSFLGSNSNWQSLLFDLRKYNHFPEGSKNTIAFWSYDWFNIAGKPPYLDLMSTAGDSYMNMGRGYVQGRFRGVDLLYLESEYRFGITSNGLIGGVVFANAQSYAETISRRFEKLLPGYGAGFRFKLNKFSKTNVALDYGFGLNGSQGIFANLGEVF